LFIFNVFLFTFYFLYVTIGVSKFIVIGGDKMDVKMLEMLKRDLKEAVEKKDIKKIDEISNILNISEEQRRYFDTGLTGYPSVDKVWLQFYPEGAEERATNIPVGKTIWDVIEEKMIEYYDVPALEYFGKQFSREEFRDLCYVWARTFRALGVEENEIVPIYGPFVPDISAMFFALNMIGACPYFLKLAISKESLAKETEESKIAVVYDGMWPLVAGEFSKDKYKNIIIATSTANMPSPKKQIVSFLSKMQSLKQKIKIPQDKKYIFVDDAREMANYYSGDVKCQFIKNRNAVITSSSGTSDGIGKGVIATNESVISQAYSVINSDVPYKKGFRTLNHFPPTASTSLSPLFFVPLIIGATVVMDPRVSINDFYNQLVKLKTNICINTSSLWEAFFNRINQEMKQGKKFNFDYAVGWMVGGEGTSVKIFENWNNIMNKCGARGIYGGYGLSENFSGISTDRVDVEPNYSKPIAGVGLIQAGMIAGVFDNEGRELTYNQRGELRVKSNSRMKGYYNKPQLTSEAIVDGWIQTGDIAEIDDKGFLYVWGRVTNSIKSKNGMNIYLFDIENLLRKNSFIKDVMVLSMPLNENKNNLVAHIVWNAFVLEESKKEYIDIMNKQLSDYLPNDIELSAYAEHDTMLPYSPTTLKKDKNKMSQQTTGYYQLVDGKMYSIEYILNANGNYSKKCAILSTSKVKTLNRK